MRKTTKWGLGAIAYALVAGAFVVCAATANAATIFTTNQAAYLAANPGLALEDFESIVLASGASAATGVTSLNSSTNTATFPTGSVIPGFTFSPTAGDIYASRDFGGNTGANISSNFFNADINITFAPGVTAVGIDLLQWLGNNGPWSLQVFDTADVLLGSFATPAGSFVGITSTDAIGRLFLDKPNSGAVIDNLRFGRASVPEPSGLLLLGLGVAAGLRRWQR